MTHRYIKIGVTATVLLLAFTGLLWSTLQDGTQYFKHVDEVMASRSQWEGKPLQLIDNPQRRLEMQAYVSAARPQVERAAFDLISGVVAAFNDARRKVSAHAEQEMQKLTGGLQLPGGLKLPF